MNQGYQWSLRETRGGFLAYQCYLDHYNPFKWLSIRSKETTEITGLVSFFFRTIWRLWCMVIKYVPVWQVLFVILRFEYGVVLCIFFCVRLFNFFFQSCNTARSLCRQEKQYLKYIFWQTTHLNLTKTKICFSQKYPPNPSAVSPRFPCTDFAWSRKDSYIFSV